MEEAIEKHETLNPKLWDDNGNLKPEVHDKLMEIVDDFLEDLKEDDIDIIVKDIKLVGSNCSYNYTNDSDLDVHIEADTKSLKCPFDLYPLIYSAYRSIWNSKYDPTIYDIPVEIFVETSDTEHLEEKKSQKINKSKEVQSLYNLTGLYNIKNKYPKMSSHLAGLKGCPVVIYISDDFNKGLGELNKSILKDDKMYVSFLKKFDRNIGYINDRGLFDGGDTEKIHGIDEKYKIYELKLGDVNKKPIRILYFKIGKDIIFANIFYKNDNAIPKRYKLEALDIYKKVYKIK